MCREHTYFTYLHRSLFLLEIEIRHVKLTIIKSLRLPFNSVNIFQDQFEVKFVYVYNYIYILASIFLCCFPHPSPPPPFSTCPNMGFSHLYNPLSSGNCAAALERVCPKDGYWTFFSAFGAIRSTALAKSRPPSYSTQYKKCTKIR